MHIGWTEDHSYYFEPLLSLTVSDKGQEILQAPKKWSIQNN